MMSTQPCFIDSNVWLYRLMVDPNSNQTDEIRKRALAINLIDNSEAFVSTQVINEVCSVLYRKAAFNDEQIKRVIQSFYNRATEVKLNQEILENACNLRTQYSFSFWDGLIVSSALSTSATTLYSEDMQDGLFVEKKLTIINPFK
ncbi:ribonuclease VapC [Dulcicalothrix desertica PCC 7102]|jgi:predicted nucleic acid-binding protein|uniref:Ribonuclease VapC n=1 Tax=Dulcicalothrix desertica PCC 7102 TaxID=232991 RepID=A0A3S1CZK5_9CYAN|nr:PIN domain-containing protein [Dulcicalothrix desertica]RUT00850.1 ribonuclease VapC [Dulcicalothrix desertica PCC 7102]TWH42312.1 putative nucleic acid-binding protein [Dulcicalothrix desertica PCC 7102]